MQLGHTLVIAPEKRGEVLRQILFVDLGQGADNAEIQRNITAKGGWVHADLNVAGVHVRMKEAVAENLCEKQRDAVTRQLGDIHTGLPQARHLADGNAIHALHDNDLRGAVIPIHLRNQHQIQPSHVAPQLCCTGRFAHQVKLVMQVFVKLGHDLARLESFAVV